MLQALAIFLIFLYFKIARVHKKEEFLSKKVLTMHIIVAVSAFLIFAYAFSHSSPFIVLTEAFLSFIFAALMVTAVQVGIFVDGKPFIKMSQVYKSMPILTATIALFAGIFWL